MSNSTQSVNEVVSDLIHDVDVRQHLVQWQHLPTEYSTWTVPLLALSALQLHTLPILDYHEVVLRYFIKLNVNLY